MSFWAMCQRRWQTLSMPVEALSPVDCQKLSHSAPIQVNIVALKNKLFPKVPSKYLSLLRVFFRVFSTFSVYIITFPFSYHRLKVSKNSLFKSVLQVILLSPSWICQFASTWGWVIWAREPCLSLVASLARRRMIRRWVLLPAVAFAAATSSGTPVRLMYIESSSVRRCRCRLASWTPACLPVLPVPDLLPWTRFQKKEIIRSFNFALQFWYLIFLLINQ